MPGGINWSEGKNIFKLKTTTKIHKAIKTDFKEINIFLNQIGTDATRTVSVVLKKSQ